MNLYAAKCHRSMYKSKSIKTISWQSVTVICNGFTYTDKSLRFKQSGKKPGNQSYIISNSSLKYKTLYVHHEFVYESYVYLAFHNQQNKKASIPFHFCARSFLPKFLRRSTTLFFTQLFIDSYQHPCSVQFPALSCFLMRSSIRA